MATWVTPWSSSQPRIASSHQETPGRPVSAATDLHRRRPDHAVIAPSTWWSPSAFCTRRIATRPVTAAIDWLTAVSRRPGKRRSARVEPAGRSVCAASTGGIAVAPVAERMPTLVIARTVATGTSSSGAAATRSWTVARKSALSVTPPVAGSQILTVLSPSGPRRCWARHRDRRPPPPPPCQGA